MGLFGEIFSEVAKDFMTAAAAGAAAGVAEGLAQKPNRKNSQERNNMLPSNAVLVLNDARPGPSCIYAATQRKLRPFVNEQFVQVESNGCWYLDCGEMENWRRHLRCCLADGIDQLFETNYWADETDETDPYLESLAEKFGFSMNKSYPGLVQKNHKVPIIRAVLDVTWMKCKQRQHDLYPNIEKIKTITCLCSFMGENLCVAISFEDFPELSIPEEVFYKLELPTIDDI